DADMDRDEIVAFTLDQLIRQTRSCIGRKAHERDSLAPVDSPAFDERGPLRAKPATPPIPLDASPRAVSACLVGETRYCTLSPARNPHRTGPSAAIARAPILARPCGPQRPRTAKYRRSIRCG